MNNNTNKEVNFTVTVPNATRGVMSALNKIMMCLEDYKTKDSNDLREYLKVILAAVRIPVVYSVKTTWHKDGNTVNFVSRGGLATSNFDAIIANRYYSVILREENCAIKATIVSTKHEAVINPALVKQNITPAQQTALRKYEIYKDQPITLQGLIRYGFDMLLPEDIDLDCEEWVNFTYSNNTLYYNGKPLAACSIYIENEKSYLLKFKEKYVGKSWALVRKFHVCGEIFEHVKEIAA